MKIVVDMNLSVEWISTLEAAGFTARHWSAVGDPRDGDSEIMAWAKANGFVVFTHDFDFSTALALTHADGPSVIQIRGQRVLPDHVGKTVIDAIHQCENDLDSGALVVVEQSRNRVRILPL